MLNSISGKLVEKKPSWAIIETSGLGFKVMLSSRSSRELPKAGSHVRVFTYLHVSQNGVTLYGFASEKEREIFELLNSINGIGPKGGIRILEAMKIPNLLSAIRQNRGDLLVKAGGIGEKKASRIILELKDKIKSLKLSGEPEDLEADLDLEDVLRTLGYKEKEIRAAKNKLPDKSKTLEEKVKAALKILGRER